MRYAVAFALVLLAPLARAGESLSAGLVATYRSPDGKESVQRIDAKPALAIGSSSPHPRIAPGAFSASWNGMIVVREDGPLSFDAFLGGELTVTIDNAVVLHGRGESETAQIRSAQPFNRPPGRYRIAVEYRALPNVPARLQIGWQGPGFSREPLPSWVLKHAPDELPKAARLEEAGREAAGKFGCAYCHGRNFPTLRDPIPGPNLENLRARVNRDWLVKFLEQPHAHMPALFTNDRDGFVERSLIADHLPESMAKLDVPENGDHRRGRKEFLSLGCVACHLAPDISAAEQKGPERHAFKNLGDRLPAKYLFDFLNNPQGRYARSGHPNISLTMEKARDISAYLLLWSKPLELPKLDDPPTPQEILKVVHRMNKADPKSAAKVLLGIKGCIACHEGLGPRAFPLIPIKDNRRGCLSENGSVRFNFDARTREALTAYTAIAPRESHPSPPAERRALIERLGCFRCHSTDDRPPPLEQYSALLGGSLLEAVPYLRTPRLNNAVSKYSHDYLLKSIRDGVSGVRPGKYSYRMPHYGAQAEEVVQALAEMDGELLAEPPPARPASDPTLSGPGAALVGFEGYSCVSCHMWNGKQFADADPGAIGPDLTTVGSRIRRDFFERWVESPSRIHPGTMMPQIFSRDAAAPVKTVLDGDVAKQKDAIWAYLSLGKDAPSPKPMTGVPVTPPAKGEPPLVAQIPVKLPDGKSIESICIYYGTGDLLVYDIGQLKLTHVFTGAQILRSVRGRLRTFSITGTLHPNLTVRSIKECMTRPPESAEFSGYERLDDGVRIKLHGSFPEEGAVEGIETLRVANGKFFRSIEGYHLKGRISLVGFSMPPSIVPPNAAYPQLPDSNKIDFSLERPGYRAIAYPRPKTRTGEDLIMPTALAVNPADGRVFVASMKMGELFVLRDPNDNGVDARFDNYAGGLFQEAYSMLAEKDALYVLHRRNLTRISEDNGRATKFDRVFATTQAVTDAYDYGYGLVRDKAGAFYFSHAPYGDRKMSGAGSLLRWPVGEKPEEIAYGFRNPVGWCNGPDSEIFYTDNQGEWVASSKLCHIVKGRFYGFPDPDQKEHKSKPFGKTTLWVPYAWARSINGVTYSSSDKFGPFGGQFFLAELMYGGAVIRASLEKVNGEYQGACFPFWGKGLLGPVSLAFDPKGRLFVGGITEPGWMSQPDRGALFRIDFTGQTPFEIHSINAMPRGFRLNFTQPADAASAAAAASYAIEHFRYEYTGAYGSPELDRTPVTVEKITLAADGRSVELQTGALVKERVYMIHARGVKSAAGEALVHDTGAYTLNEIP